MVLKPSEVAPLSAYLYAEIMDEAGVPAGVFNLVNGDGPTVGEALSRHPDVDMMFSRLNPRGLFSCAKCNAHDKRVTQELGGKSPNIILDDADLERRSRVYCICTTTPDSLVTRHRECLCPARY